MLDPTGEDKVSIPDSIVEQKYLNGRLTSVTVIFKDKVLLDSKLFRGGGPMPLEGPAPTGANILTPGISPPFSEPGPVSMPVAPGAVRLSHHPETIVTSVAPHSALGLVRW